MRDPRADRLVERLAAQEATDEVLLSFRFNSKYVEQSAHTENGMILVTGATGTTGSELVRQLAAKGAATRAFARDTEKARPLRDGRIAMVDARDIAAVAATALTEEGHTGKIYPITGPAALSMDEVASRIGAAIATTVKYIDMPPEASYNAMVDGGMPGWFADDLVKLAQMFAAGHGTEVFPTVEQIIGSPARSFEQLVANFADAFRS